jgi:hypothetical protein
VARRREAPERDAAAAAELPLRLRRFDPDEWEVGPSPAWWDDADRSWRRFKAKLEWHRAGQAWRQQHGLTLEEFAVLRGAHGPGCQHSPTPYCSGGSGPPAA